MYLTRQEHFRNRTISILVTVSIFSTLILFFTFQKLIPPDPPFLISKKGNYSGISFACFDQNNVQVNYDQIGIATEVIANEEIHTSEKNNLSISKETIKTKALSSVRQVSMKYKNKTIRVNDNYNNAIGTQEGPFENSAYNSNTKQLIVLSGKNSGFTIDLKGSTLLQMPDLPKNTQEEGKVVVNIVVDENGAVIEADASGRGTTTGSAVLKAKARQAAFATKFNTDNKNPYRRGSITIIFAFD